MQLLVGTQQLQQLQDFKVLNNKEPQKNNVKIKWHKNAKCQHK
jgi:hypothetical protein